LKKTIFYSVFLVVLFGAVSCSVRYSFTGGQFSGAKTFSVDFFRPVTALASQTYAQRFTESLKDFILAQSPLTLVEKDGELRYEGSITDYRVTPVAIQGNETAASSRLSITIKVKYTNTLESDLNFEKSFTKFADFPADQDLFSAEEGLWTAINEQLTQEVYNSSVGNW
jgi:hypothetical protein